MTLHAIRELGGSVEPQHTQRKLAAILAADVIGHSGLMDQDEVRMHKRL
jgi:hypothetical protein